mmetsp:Transcript_60728/g.198846  ORF Transcript_60728/g.198846 Transcript_60728/m.198846 type:complete len:202 (-) Transcript_60728:1040-1645(-)
MPSAQRRPLPPQQRAHSMWPTPKHEPPTTRSVPRRAPPGLLKALSCSPPTSSRLPLPQTSQGCCRPSPEPCPPRVSACVQSLPRVRKKYGGAPSLWRLVVRPPLLGGLPPPSPRPRAGRPAPGAWFGGRFGKLRTAPSSTPTRPAARFVCPQSPPTLPPNPAEPPHAPGPHGEPALPAFATQTLRCPAESSFHPFPPGSSR